jgi:2-oxoglutarate dehydrogenase E2 component (dihydrolipoamide succinyltransferase)
MSEKRIELIIPALGESISEATIARWLKNPGDPVKIDEPLVELETDKVTVNLPAPAAGVLGEQTHQAGAVVRVGASIGVLVGGATATTPAKSPSKPPKAADKPSQRSAATPVPAAPPVEKAAGKAVEKAADKAPEKAADKPAAPKAAEAAPPAEPAAPGGSAPLITNSPALRQWRREHGVDPAAALFSQAAGDKAGERSEAAPAQAAPLEEKAAREEIVQMSPLRRRIAERLVEAQHTAAILTTFNEVDMSQIMALRQKHQDDFTKKHGIKLGFMSFFVVACARSLAEFPGLNAEVRRDEGGGLSVVYKKHYDFGIAVGGGKGLVVPVLRNVDTLGFAAIEKGIAELATRAKENKLTLDELRGGTFSISNGGIYGSMMSTPLLNLPQTGILGMHNIVRRPIAVGDEVQIRPMMYVALSYDHRVVDGREAVSFLVKVKERLEQPDRLLFGL